MGMRGKRLSLEQGLVVVRVGLYRKYCHHCQKGMMDYGYSPANKYNARLVKCEPVCYCNRCIEYIKKMERSA